MQTVQTVQITLESLLDPSSEYFGNVEDLPEPEEIAIECMEILEEISILEQNMVTIEAAKQIKKAKSSSKKTKITKSKMKAKDAKAKKKSGKVIKITKESDAAFDGGTGPLPTTDDNEGMTETDLDADPDATVEVTEKVDGEAAGIEGIDYIVEYECASELIALEADNKNFFKKMIDAVIEFFKRIGDFFVKQFNRILEKLDFNSKFLETRKADITAGLGSANIQISSNYKVDVPKLKTYLKDLEISFSDAAGAIPNAEVGADIYKQLKILGEPTVDGDHMRSDLKELHTKAIFPEVSAKMSTPPALGFADWDSLHDVVGYAALQSWKKIFAKGKENVTKAIKALEDKKNKSDTDKKYISDMRKVGSILQWLANQGFSFFGKAASLGTKVMRAAADGKK
jgi:hypothetical protein